MADDHYRVLGVAADASAAQLRRAYLDLARRHHPDFHTADDGAARAAHARRMQAVNEAWAVLGDPGARVRYDRARATGAGAAVRGGPEMPAGKGWTPRPGDDGWMDDFAAWAAEEDVLAPDDPARARQGLISVLPVGLFALGVVLGLFAVVLELRPLLAASVMAVVLAAILMAVLPVLVMVRARRDDP